MSATSPPLQCEERDAAALAGDHGFWELYGDSFARHLREPAGQLVAAVRAGCAVAISATDEDRCCGLGVAHLLRSPAVTLVLYLAVAPELRGQRIGGTLLEQLLVVADARHREAGRSPRGWAAQLELPELAADHAELDRRRRLQTFLRAHKARQLPVAWVRPAVRGGPPASARLFFAATDGYTLRRDEVQALVRAIYFEKYAETNGLDRERLEALLAPAPRGAPVGIGIVGPRALWPPGPP